MNGKLADPKALGFGVFATGAWLFSMSMAGFMPVVYGTPLQGVTLFVGIGLLVAGVAAFLHSDSWLGFFFILWAAVAWGLGTSLTVGWFWLALALMNLYLSMAASRSDVEPAIGLVAFLVGIDALGQGLFGVVGLTWAAIIGSYFGLAAAAAAFYVSAATVGCPEGNNNLPLLKRKGDSV